MGVSYKEKMSFRGAGREAKKMFYMIFFNRTWGECMREKIGLGREAY